MTGLRRLPERLLIGAVRGYRLFFSAWLGSNCRYEPTCSAYALGALQRHGAAAGSYLGMCRIGRCHPWCPGGADPVPAEPPRLFRRTSGSAPLAAGSSAPTLFDKTAP